MIPRTISFLILTLLANNLHSQPRVDPYHRSSGGYGYLLERSEGRGSIWWCEGAYKVMKDTPVPSRNSRAVELFAAGNEFEPFQLVINPSDTLFKLEVTTGNPIGPGGASDSIKTTVRRVEYVNITRSTDNYGYEGPWPDPLPLESGEVILPGENTTLWFTLYIPAGTTPGRHSSVIRLASGSWSIEVPVVINVWDFTLPSTPSVRSGFGLSVDKIADYHNPGSPEELSEIFDLYMQSFRDYRIAPYSFYYLTPVQVNTTGTGWEGGLYDPTSPYSGRYALKVTDNDPAARITASSNTIVDIIPGTDYTARWAARSESPDQQYHVLIRGYDSSGERLVFENRMETFTADTAWGSYDFRVLKFNKRVSFASVELYPAFSTPSGESTGTVWFDNMEIIEESSGRNIITGGDFEISADSVDLSLDFTEFDRAAERYLDRFGFNSFRLTLEGMGSGTYYSRQEGTFQGFMQGTPEYEKLMGRYLSLMAEHLREKGWLGKEYIYWFDEPGREDYPFVREGMELIRRGSPDLTTFLTENDPGPEIMDVTDITCTIFHRIDPAKALAVSKRGQEYWSYLCTAPKAPWVSEFIDHDAVNLRIWLWYTYAWKLDGILIWSSNYWTSRSASPPGYLQNPWDEPASYVQGYGWPLGKQTQWGNGDGRFFYPPNRDPQNDRSTYLEGPVPSVRLEFLRQGIEDYEYFRILEALVAEKGDSRAAVRAGELLKIPKSILSDGKTYTRDPKVLIDYRRKIAEAIIQLNRER